MKHLVTMALPYANGSIHLGHLVEAVQTDVYVRALRAMGREVVFICADDQHGTPIEVNAAKAGVTPEQFVERFYEEHQRDYAAFEIGFDHFYKTHSEENRRQAESFFAALQRDGAVEKRPVEQFFCEKDRRFLPDRFVKGTCPRCGAADQYGDACEKCGSTYEPTDLVDPRCVLCGTPPVRQSSIHYFVRLSKYQGFLKEWTAAPGRLQPEIKNFVDRWLGEPLKDWDVSRDAPYFGFEIPGETGKYFYVWLDAPIGYLSSTEHWAAQTGRDYRKYWGRDGEYRIEHFIGKDIIYFHTLFWPAMLHAAGHKTPARVHAHGMLTIEGEKMSKSRGTFLNGRQYLDAGLDPEWLRYFYASNLGPPPSDIDLSFTELKNRVNGELLNNLANLANRALSVLWKSLDGQFGPLPRDAEAAEWEAGAGAFAREVFAAYERIDSRAAVQSVLAMASRANQRLQRTQPWKLMKDDREAARAELTLAINVARLCAFLLSPVVPRFARGVEEQTAVPLSGDFVTAGRIREPRPLVRRVEESDIEKATAGFTRQIPAGQAAPQAAGPGPQAPEISIEQFAAVDLRAGKVLAAERIPKADKLLKLSIDLGEGAPRTVVAGIAQQYAPEDLVGKTVAVVANLAKKPLRGIESHGMVLAASGGARGLAVVELPGDVAPGSKMK